MAKRLHFSVVGLPHYTIWHLYEPSVDDLRHMEEMEKERKEKEEKEKAERDRLEKIKQQFDNPSSQWDKDKSDIRDLAKKEYLEKEKQKEREKANALQKPATKPQGPGEMSVLFPLDIHNISY